MKGAVSTMALLFSVMPLSSCTSIRHVDQRPSYDLVVFDNVDQSRFDLTFSSSESKPLCFEVEKWPNDRGEVSAGSYRAKMVYRDGTLSAKDANFGFCPGGCGIIVVLPGETLTGFIPYAEFGDPKEIEGLPDRRLEYHFVPRFCTSTELRNHRAAQDD